MAVLIGTAAGIIGEPSSAWAQRTVGAVTSANAAQSLGMDRKPGAQVSLDTAFRDEAGKTVPLRTWFGGKPVVLVMPFYKCPGVCTAELNGLAKVLGDQRLKYRIGSDFEVVTVSIDPTEGAELATRKKQEYLNLLGRPDAADGWRFLTGAEAPIEHLATEVGFRYSYDPKTKGYTHPAGLILLTPEGKVAQYLSGVEFAPTDLRLALTEAGQGSIGSLADRVTLYCCTVDPVTGAYTIAIARVVQLAGCFSVLLVGAFVLIALRVMGTADRRGARHGGDRGVGRAPKVLEGAGELR